MPAPPRSSKTGLVPALATAMLLAGCPAPPEPPPPPLRPLLYTEAPPGGIQAPEGLQEWGPDADDPVAWPSHHATRSGRGLAEPDAPRHATTPEALAEQTLRALIGQRPDLLEPLLFDAPLLQQSARMTAAGAEREAERVRTETLALMRALQGGPGAQPDWMLQQLRQGQVTLGRPRRIDGSATDDPAETVLHWGTDITFHHADYGIQFTLRLPRLLRAPDGTWRLQETPQTDWKFDTFRNLGLHLPETLMTGTHAAWPLATGNFWHYRVRTPSADPDALAALQTGDGFRDEVTDVVSFGTWRLVRVLRTHDRGVRSPERFAYLQTPRQVYHCPRDCQRRAGELEWILAFARHQTPLLVMPTHSGMSWGAGGTTGRSDTVRAHASPVPVEVPGGTFHEATELTRTTARGREVRHHVRGIGTVSRRLSGHGASTVEELTGWRVLH